MMKVSLNTRIYLLLGALLCAGCNIGDDYNKSAKGCTSNAECEPMQICAFDGRCTGPSSQTPDMSQDTLDMATPSPDLGPEDMGPLDLGQPVAEDMPPDVPPDMAQPVDMSGGKDMNTTALPPAFTRFELAAGEEFALAAAAVSSTQDLLMVGQVRGTEAAFLYHEPSIAPSGFKLSAPGQSYTSFTGVAVNPDGDALIIGQSDAGGAGASSATSFSMVIDSSGQRNAGMFYESGITNITAQAVTSTRSDWFMAGTTGRDNERFFVARLNGDGRVDRARQVMPAPNGAADFEVEVIAMQGHEDSVYVITHIIGSGVPQHTLVSRHQDTSLEPDWVKQVSGALLEDLTVIESSDAVYLTGQSGVGNNGYLIALEANTGDLVEAHDLQDRAGKRLYWREEESDVLWLTTVSLTTRSNTRVHRIDLSSTAEADGVTISGLDTVNSPSALVGRDGYPTLIANRLGDRTLDVYPLDDTPRAACGDAEFGTPNTLALSQIPMNIEEASYDDTTFQIDDQDQMFGTQPIDPATTSPICQ